MDKGPRRTPEIEPYTGPAGGYGSLRSVGEVLLREGHSASTAAVMMHQNKPGGFMCVSCAWGKPAEPSPFEYCENGAKATAWELTSRRADREFFAKHTLTELESWLDYDLEEAGRLTVPMRYDRASDRYVPTTWEEAYSTIGRELRALAGDPDQVVFYTSGRASLETSYMFQLLARMYGTNNLPDSSNMCHESTSVALPQSIGVPVGTVGLEDFEQADLLLYIGHNPGTSSPRILHPLQNAAKRGARIIGVNPLRERGLERFTNPQSPKEMLLRSETRIADEILQVRAGGDIALMVGVCKLLIEADAVDHGFVAEHTNGFEAFAAYCRAAEWAELERQSGLPRASMQRLADAYAAAERVLLIYGMGVTQHVRGVEAVRMLVNLLLLRGQIGRPGAGICPVRGHSNVQGQRTVGITEKPELAPLDAMRDAYAFEPPRHKGMNLVEACEGMQSGRVRAMVQLGGNVVRAAPDSGPVEEAWRRLRLTVSIATKLNRSHLVHGEVAYLLPCLGRIEVDEQAGGPQTVTMEDSLARFHASRGRATPAADTLRSEPAIVAGIATATLPPNPAVPWESWAGEYEQVRAEIERVMPDVFAGLSEGAGKPGGLVRPLAARDRVWKTTSGKAEFVVPTALFAGHLETLDAEGVADADDVPQQRPVQHDDLRLRRPVPGCQRDPPGAVHEPGGYRPAVAGGRGSRGYHDGDRHGCAARGAGIPDRRVRHPRGHMRGVFPGGEPAGAVVASGHLGAYAGRTRQSRCGCARRGSGGGWRGGGRRCGDRAVFPPCHRLGLGAGGASGNAAGGGGVAGPAAGAASGRGVGAGSGVRGRGAGRAISGGARVRGDRGGCGAGDDRDGPGAVAGAVVVRGGYAATGAGAAVRRIVAWDSLFHLSHADQRRMVPVLRAHAAPGAGLLFTTGPAHGVSVGTFAGEALFHASLSGDGYRSLLQAERFAVVAHTVEDPACGGRTVWLARRSE